MTFIVTLISLVIERFFHWSQLRRWRWFNTFQQWLSHSSFSRLPSFFLLIIALTMRNLIEANRVAFVNFLLMIPEKNLPESVPKQFPILPTRLRQSEAMKTYSLTGDYLKFLTSRSFRILVMLSSLESWLTFLMKICSYCSSMKRKRYLLARKIR